MFDTAGRRELTELVKAQSQRLTEKTFSDALKCGSADVVSNCSVSQLSVTAAGLRTKIWMISFKPTL